MYRAVVFDLDNTLYAERSYRDAAYWSIAVRLGRRFGWRADKVHKHLLHVVDSLDEHAAFERLLQDFGMDDSYVSACIEQVIVPAYTTCVCNLELYDDARSLLRELTQRNIPIGLVTNGSKQMQWNKIRLLDIQRYFKCIIVAGEHFDRDRWKPHQAPFEMCFTRLGMNPADCLYVGDSPELDVPGAASLGAKVLLIRRDAKSTNASDCIQLNNLTRVMDWLT
ncbi:HAD family hydrolase [bacterium]|nr:HAD family hydrolase [bacterium]